jgi:hypothetical protein
MTENPTRPSCCGGVFSWKKNGRIRIPFRNVVGSLRISIYR